MDKIFKPKSVAVVGASATSGKIGNILIKNLQNKSNRIKIFPVNPKGGSIKGLKVYTTVLEIQERIDLAVIAVPALFVNKVVEECAWREKPIQNIIIISAGFGEGNDKEGLLRKKKLENLIEKYNLRVLGPNCLGIINGTKEINISFAKKDVPSGKIGLISQSGAFITAMIDIAEKNNFGFSLISSLGNKINISENELLDYYLQDKHTKIIALYLESIKNGSIFQKKLKEASKCKPVVIIKAGNTERTQRAIQSHTGSMAGEAAVVREVIKDTGGILIDNLEDFVNIIKLLNNFPPVLKKQMTVITNAGGPGVITTDLLAKYDLNLFEFTEQQKSEMKKYLPLESSVDNPIDLLGDSLEDRYDNIIKILIKLKNLGGIIILVTPQSQTPVKKIIEIIAHYKNSTSIPIFPVVIGGEAEIIAEKVCQKYNFNNFSFPVKLIRVLGLLTEKYANEEKVNKKTFSRDASGKKLESHKNRKNAKRLISYQKAWQISQDFNLNTLSAYYPQGEKELIDLLGKLKMPLVMKVDSPNIIHKNEKNGVVTGLNSPKEILAEFKRFQQDFPGEKILIQEQVESGLEIILGLKRDANFGQVLIIGLGGIMTEILNEKVLFIGEASVYKILKKLQQSKINKIFTKQKMSLLVLAEQAYKLWCLGENKEEVVEVDINPIFFYQDREPIIVDFKIMVDN